MQLVGTLREGAYTVNMNRQGRKFWPTVSKLVRVEPNHALAFRTLTNYSTWEFEISSEATGSILTERRLVPKDGTSWVSKTIVEHLLGGEDSFDEEMVDGMQTTLREWAVSRPVRMASRNSSASCRCKGSGRIHPRV